ncbi:hypothetical protein C8C98_2787 [Acidovorax sp. 106]|nr:hypothetical protein C8C98_2787 [Acidovorax sp. 106]
MQVSTTYDPDFDPDPSTWRSIDAHDRVRLVISHHAQNRISVSDNRMHALLHVNIENMLLQGKGPVTRALEKLRAEGHPRHKVIHILATVWLAYPVGSIGGSANLTHQEQQLAFNAAMETITGEGWLQLHKHLRSKLKKDLQ